MRVSSVFGASFHENLLMAVLRWRCDCTDARPQELTWRSLEATSDVLGVAPTKDELFTADAASRSALLP